MAEEPKQDRGVKEIFRKSWGTSKEIFRKSWGTGKEFSRQNPTLATLLATLVASLLYLYVTGIGLFYSWFLYRRFGINIFDYSESSDFLLAALKNPFALILISFEVVVALVFLFWGEVQDKALGYKREGEGLSPGTKVTAIIVVLFIATAPVWASYGAARRTASAVKEGYNPAVDVQYRTFSSSADPVTKPGLQHIGATQKAVFFYDAVDKENKRTIVIPQSQIVSIEVPE